VKQRAVSRENKPRLPGNQRHHGNKSSQSCLQITERAETDCRHREALPPPAIRRRGGPKHQPDHESIREQAEAVAENVVALSEKTQMVGEIIATVNDIADSPTSLP